MEPPILQRSRDRPDVSFIVTPVEAEAHFVRDHDGEVRLATEVERRRAWRRRDFGVDVLNVGWPVGTANDLTGDELVGESILGSMAYELTAVIADEALLRTKATDVEGTRVVQVRHGLGLLPLPHAVVTQLRARYPGERWPEFSDLQAGFASVLAGWSMDGPVAYVEAEIHAGVGAQSALVWEGGKVVLETGWRSFPGRQEQPTAISEALQRLGVRASGPSWDEFDTVGLSRGRRTEQWLEPCSR